MKIFAESRPAANLPFVHLGYLAASYVKPQGGLLMAGGLFTIAGLLLIVRFLTGETWRAGIRAEERRRIFKIGAIGTALLLAGIVCACVAWKTEGRYYPHGDEMTSMQMQDVLRYVEMKVNNTPDEFTKEYGSPIKALPAQAGEYDLAAAVQNKQEKFRFVDGWGVPMKLKVVVKDGQKAAYVLMSAGVDRTWNTADDVTSLKYAPAWEKR